MQQGIIVGDGLEVLANLPPHSVDAIISDPPYGTTELDFDQLPIDWAAFWVLARCALRTKNSPVVLFSQQPFTSLLIYSNLKGWRDEIVYEKTMATGFLNAKRKPLKAHELIEIFADAGPQYDPQMEVSVAPTKRLKADNTKAPHYKNHTRTERGGGVVRYPRSVWKYSQRDADFGHHPTQKPLALMERLVLTYSRPFDLVFDPFAGSGSTLVAARNTGRLFLGVELDPHYVEIAQTRLDKPYTISMFGGE